jgi:hypothetical protein
LEGGGSVEGTVSARERRKSTALPASGPRKIEKPESTEMKVAAARRGGR